jgi:hypothetical protein
MIRNSIDAENYKEKLRLRSYGIPEDDGKVFLELKKKFDGVVYKRREIMTYSEAKDYIYTRKKTYDTQIMREIDYVMRVYEGLAPAAFLSYDRESFVGIHDDGLRITFDSNIIYRFEDVRLESGIYGRSLLPPDMYIMEIKVLGAIPMWLVRELSACEIYKGSYSKYGTAYHQSASKSKEMISNAKAYCQSKGVPDNFVAFECTPTSGAQKFVAWGYYSDGSVKIIKKSAANNSYKTGAYNFSNIKFKVYESKNTSGKCLGTLTCNAEGTTSKLKLSPDGNRSKTYYIKEYASNDYYELNENWYSVKISSGENEKVTIKNTPKYGSLTFNKGFTSDSKKGVSVDGYTFILTNKNDSSVKYTAKSKNGIVTFDKVLLGTYILTEKLTESQLSEGVENVTEPQSVKIKAGKNTLNTSDNTFYNKCLPIKDPALTILKTCNDGGRLDGFDFRVQGPDGFNKTFTTDENGRIKIYDIEEGKYIVTEVMTDNQKIRYRQPEVQIATLSEESDTNISFVFENEAVKHPVKLVKTSSDGNVEGIGFKVTGVKFAGTGHAEEINALYGTTDEDGVIDFGEFVPGKYILEEIDYDSNAYVNKYSLKGYDNPAIAFDVTAEGVFIGEKK